MRKEKPSKCAHIYSMRYFTNSNCAPVSPVAGLLRSFASLAARQFAVAARVRKLRTPEAQASKIKAQDFAQSFLVNVGASVRIITSGNSISQERKLNDLQHSIFGCPTCTPPRRLVSPAKNEHCVKSLFFAWKRPF